MCQVWRTERATLASSAFHREGHRKVRARLRHAGVRASGRRVLQPMRDHGLLAPTRVGAPRGPRAHDGAIVPDGVDVLWGTDPTTITGKGQVAVFVTLDHASAECVGIHAARRATRFGDLKPIRQGVRRRVGPSGSTSPAADIHNGSWVMERHGFRPPAAIRTERLSAAAQAA